MNLKKGKLVRGLFVALSVLLAFCMLATGCNEPESICSGIPELTVFDNYPSYGSQSFVKFKVDTIYDEVYASGGYAGAGKYLLLEGTVIEDYYGNIDTGTIVTIPVSLFYQKNSDDRWAKPISSEFEKDEVAGWLQEFENFYVYLRRGPNKNGYLYPENSQRMEFIDSLTAACEIDDYNIFPINDGKVSLGSVEAFLEKHNVCRFYPQDYLYFEDLIKDGQEESEFAESIKRIYEYNKGE